jgi:2-dehydropantoate 2-reductase
VCYAPKALIRPVLRSQIGGARGGKLPSLHIDLHSGKGRSEVGWLNGAVVRKGQEVGVKTPVNRALTEVLSALVANPAELGAWHSNHARLVQTAYRAA